MRKRLKCEKLLMTADTSDDNTEHKALGPGELKRAKIAVFKVYGV
jgi:hypothetical protein